MGVQLFLYLSVCFVLFWFDHFYLILFLDTCLLSNEREKDLGGEEVGMLQEDLKEGKLKSEYTVWKYIYFQIKKKKKQASQHSCVNQEGAVPLAKAINS